MPLFRSVVNRTNAAEQAGHGQPVILKFNEESVSVPAAVAQGRSIRDLFNSFADQLGDVSRANRYTNVGRVIDGDTVVSDGMVVSATYTSETKGWTPVFIAWIASDSIG